MILFTARNSVLHVPRNWSIALPYVQGTCYTGHAIHKCWRFTEKNVSERIKFVQMSKLCFGCLKLGHRSKNCEDRSICETCKKKHPTCLHEDRTKETKKFPKSEQTKEK